MADSYLDLQLANVTRLLDLATSMAIDDPERITHEGRDGYFSACDRSEELTAILVVTRDYARRALAEHDEQRAEASNGDRL